MKRLVIFLAIAIMLSVSLPAFGQINPDSVKLQGFVLGWQGVDVTAQGRSATMLWSPLFNMGKGFYEVPVVKYNTDGYASFSNMVYLAFYQSPVWHFLLKGGAELYTLDLGPLANNKTGAIVLGGGVTMKVTELITVAADFDVLRRVPVTLGNAKDVDVLNPQTLGTQLNAGLGLIFQIGHKPEQTPVPPTR